MAQDKTAAKPVDWTKKEKGFSYLIFFLILIGALVLGVGGGSLGNFYGPNDGSSSAKKGEEATAKGVGIADKKEFPDQVEGVLKEGGIDGEGNFHLIRPGGDSQNVYLTSSTVDLTKFIGKKIRVWGKTFEGEKAGWLMDVGYVESL